MLLPIRLKNCFKKCITPADQMEQKLIFSQVMGTPMDYSVDFV